MNDNRFSRGRDLEQTFFGPMDDEVQERIREEETQWRMKSLSLASGIEDEPLLRKLVELHIGSDTLAALSLIPLVAVAWADGAIEQDEIDAVMKAAEQVGLDRDESNYKRLKQWLLIEPDSRLLEVWADYIRTLSSSMSERARETMKKQLIGRARRVAAATGGLLGLGSKISNAEQDTLDQLEKAFQ